MKDKMTILSHDEAPKSKGPFFPEQSGADALRETNEWLAKHHYKPANLGKPYDLSVDLEDLLAEPPTCGTSSKVEDLGLERQAPLPVSNYPNRPGPDWKFADGDKVVKPKGSWWCGTVVGFYSTRDTPRGYTVQYPVMNGNGAVQIYPESALELDT